MTLISTILHRRETAEALLGALSELRRAVESNSLEDTFGPRVRGICSLLREFITDWDNPAVLGLNGILQLLFASWVDYEQPGYPVPSMEAKAQDGVVSSVNKFRSCNTWEEMWGDTPYGSKRRELLDHCILTLALVLKGRATVCFPCAAFEKYKAALLQLRENLECGRKMLHSSICCFIWNTAELDGDEYDALRSVIFTVTALWEDFSGRHCYPVPSPDPDYSAEEYYDAHVVNPKEMWSGAYGDSRKRLLNHLIEYMEKLTCK